VCTVCTVLFRCRSAVGPEWFPAFIFVPSCFAADLLLVWSGSLHSFLYRPVPLQICCWSGVVPCIHFCTVLFRCKSAVGPEWFPAFIFVPSCFAADLLLVRSGSLHSFLYRPVSLQICCWSGVVPCIHFCTVLFRCRSAVSPEWFPAFIFVPSCSAADLLLVRNGSLLSFLFHLCTVHCVPYIVYHKFVYHFCTVLFHCRSCQGARIRGCAFGAGKGRCFPV